MYSKTKSECKNDQSQTAAPTTISELQTLDVAAISDSIMDNIESRISVVIDRYKSKVDDLERMVNYLSSSHTNQKIASKDKEIPMGLTHSSDPFYGEI